MPTVNLGRIRPLYKGVYAAGTAYAPLDFLSYNGMAYFCTAPSTGNLPTNAAFFQPVADVNVLASLTAAPGKIPLAGANGRVDASWWAALLPNMPINHIGIPGAPGFGVGICPALPAGFTPLSGCTDPASANYGNYQFTDGSVMCWIPAFYFRLGDAGNPTFGVHGVNSVDVKPASAFPDEPTANASGYYLHRAFINGGAVQPGFFRDKYDCSANGSIASSIAGVQPMVSGPSTGQVGFSAVGATNAYFGSFAAARTRGAKFHPETIFQADAITRISEAHAQASTSTAFCAWFDATGVRNYPKGNDNNALKSEADVTLSGAGAVTWTTAGAGVAAAFALAGSAVPFARSTHNGQACGVSDVAGNIFKINPGMTSIANTLTITAATQANPVQLTVAGHGRTTGDVVRVSSVAGMTQIHDRMFAVTVINANTLALTGTDGAAFSAFTSGSITHARFYALKPSVDIAAVTTGTSLATDHWGATGVAAQFDEVPLAFATAHPNNGLAQRYGNGANAVFSLASAASRARAMLGMPEPAGVSTSGASLFGNDQFYQFALDQLCVFSRGAWLYGSRAGGRFRHLSFARSYASFTVGFAASVYL